MDSLLSDLHGHQRWPMRRHEVALELMLVGVVPSPPGDEKVVQGSGDQETERHAIDVVADSSNALLTSEVIRDDGRKCGWAQSRSFRHPGGRFQVPIISMEL